MPDANPSDRALSFGGAADAYDRFRPGPPSETVQWLLPVRCGSALDLGAGTGALTRRLVERATRVVAIEPDPRMLAVLAARSPEVAAVRGRAEELPIAGSVLDAVVVSSAWHWMDPDSTLSEIARVLRPGGVVGVVWNGPDRTVDWVGVLLDDRDAATTGEEHRHRHRFELSPAAPFGDLDACTITWSLPMTQDEMVGLVGTYSSVITLPTEARAEVVARARERLAGSPVVGDRAAVQLPMRCRCWRAVRR